MALNVILNSTPFLQLIKIQLARTELAQSFEVGLIQQTPIPQFLEKYKSELSNFAVIAYETAREPFVFDETSHVFRLPCLQFNDGNLVERIAVVANNERERQAFFSKLQNQIDTQIAELYGVRDLAVNEVGQQTFSNGEQEKSDNDFSDEDDEVEDETVSQITNPYSLISDLLMWCVGVAFGRWDVRYALNPETLPALPEPFDPLPVCSPGMLQGADGLPLEEAPAGYPLSIASRGFLVDDPDRPQDDIVAAVRRVLQLLFGANADSIESEACQILEVSDLRAWFRDPKGFFAWHTKRYSKSRRKAPIYWLMQSAKKNYAIWLYYPRLNPDSLFYAAREYADAKLNLETARLEDLQGQLKALSGSSLKAQEKKVAAQTALVAEVKSYLKELDSAALLQLKPDLNDGVLLNMAPLREIVPWKEPARIWEELLRGKYPWSHISAQLRKKGIVK